VHRDHSPATEPTRRNRAEDATGANFQSTYSHNDPAGAYPDNAFFDRLVPFLGKVAAQK
jgi:hypothetical protein